MQTSWLRWVGLFTAVLFLEASAPGLRADQVEMQNGDRYLGKVLSLNADTLFLQSPVLGTLRLPRSKVASVTFGTTNAVSQAPLPSSTNDLRHAPVLSTTNANSDLTTALRQLRSNSNALQQVQSQFLAGANAEANNKFNQLLGGLMNGTLDLNGLRAEARSAADQLRAAKKDLGDDAGGTLDTYLSVLENFLQETAPATPVSTNKAAAAKPTHSTH